MHGEWLEVRPRAMTPNDAYMAKTLEPVRWARFLELVLAGAGASSAAAAGSAAFSDTFLLFFFFSLTSSA